MFSTLFILLPCDISLSLIFSFTFYSSLFYFFPLFSTFVSLSALFPRINISFSVIVSKSASLCHFSFSFFPLSLSLSTFPLFSSYLSLCLSTFYYRPICLGRLAFLFAYRYSHTRKGTREIMGSLCV